MTEPPKLDYRPISASEMEKLFADDTDLQKLIGECEIQTINVRENLEPEIAKQTISRFRHPTSRYEIALITDYQNKNGTKHSIISRLRIGNTVYELEIP